MTTIVRGRRLTVAFVVLLVLMGILAAPGLSRASPDRTISPAVSQAPQEAGKIILNETSIDGPALWTNVPTGEPGAGANDIIAWTGTDAGHHLNTMTVTPTGGGYSFSNKQILNETSIARPAVTVEPSQAHPPYYFLAWTGTNQAHSLNVICDGCASNRIKLTLWNETSFAAPAIAMLNGKLLLAWTGNDVGHSLNVLDITIENGRFVLGQKETLGWLGFSSNAGPGLTFNPDTTDVGARNVLLTWSDRSSNRIRVATSGSGATNWPRAGWFTYSEWSAVTPGMLGMVPYVDISHTYLAWTGIDPGHSLNLLYPAYLPLLNSTKATLRETALGGPALGFYRGARLMLAWTGTDAAHHLNLAMIDV